MLSLASRRPFAKFGALALLLGLSLWLSLYVGRGDLADTAHSARYLELRLHRSVVALFAGGSLAVSGVIVQGLFRNPLASPSVLGTTYGAELGGELSLVTLYLLLGGQAPLGLAGELLTPIGCVLGALLSLAIVLSLTPLRASAVSLLLTGFLLASLFASLSALLKSQIQESWQLTRVMSTFSLGSLSGAGPQQLALSALLAIGSTLPAWSWSRELDVLMSGEEEATALGVDVPRLRVWSVVWTAFSTAGAVAVGANVAFVGLIVPHALRRVFGYSHRSLIPAAFLGGGAFLLWCDTLCRALPLRNEIPLSVITALIGFPLFLRMLSRLERGATP
ncbi:MAG TPA: iron ABC transporter permease [Polyangiales bacterium]